MPEKSLILIDEEIGSVERIFLHRIVFDALSAGKKALYLAVQNSSEDVVREMSSYSFYDEKHINLGNLKTEGYFNNLSAVPEMAAAYDICIIDPFAVLIMDRDERNVIEFLSTLKKLSRKEDIQFFLSMDHGIAAGRTEGIIRSMADGIISFKEVLAGRRIERYAYIPKMRGMIPREEMIPILLTPDGIMVDTRQAIQVIPLLYLTVSSFECYRARLLRLPRHLTVLAPTH